MSAVRPPRGAIRIVPPPCAPPGPRPARAGATLALAALVPAALVLAALPRTAGAEPPAAQAHQERPAPKPADRAKRAFWSRHGDTAVIYTETPFFRPGDDNDLRCNRPAIAAILAGGPAPAKGKGKAKGNGGAAVLESLTRDVAGRSIGPADEFCTDRALEHARDGQPVRWLGGSGGDSLAVIPVRSFTDGGGRACRAYAVQGTMAGRPLRRYGTACRGPGGRWRPAG
ncbi:MAG: hypothetical protein H6907_14180 [Hyphomicrobiales bacterium]|nr:hypothetical protein [Hyphomicrobiales bacterium]